MKHELMPTLRMS